MSGYNVTTPGLFKVQDPALLVQADIAQLTSQIVTPHTAIIDAAGNRTYTTNEMFSNTIIRKGCTGNVTDKFPTATQIIQALEQRLTALRGREVVVKAGDYFPLTVVNQSDYDVDFTTSTGVNGTFNTVPSNEARIGYITVINTSPAKVFVDSL